MPDDRHLDAKETQLPDIKTLNAAIWRNPLKGWYNRPEKKLVTKETRMIFKIPCRTECWRKTRHNFCRDNSPFHWSKITGDFTALVNISGAFENTYDKGGIMVRADECNWMCVGMEWYENLANAMTSVTLDHTDWSLSPLPKQAEKAGVWFCFKRIGKWAETYYSFDGTDWIPLRKAYFTEQETLHVGLYGCNPLGRDELKVVFDFFHIIQ